jgi:hypothetical protein
MGASSDPVLGARYPALGHGGVRGKGDTTFPHPSSRPRAENRRPDTKYDAGYPTPGTLLPYCPTALLPDCSTAPWPYPASCIPRVRVFRRQVPGIGYRLSGTWDLVPGTGVGPTPRAEHRAPKTEPDHWKTRTPGMHPVSGIHILTEQ